MKFYDILFEFPNFRFIEDQKEELSERDHSDIFNDPWDVINGYNRDSLMGMLYCIAKALGETNPSFVPILVYIDRIWVNYENFIISGK